MLVTNPKNRYFYDLRKRLDVVSKNTVLLLIEIRVLLVFERKC